MGKTITPEERHILMTEKPVAGTIISLSGATILQQLINILYNTADTWYVANYDKTASAGVGICFALVSIMNAISFSFAMGASNLMSMKLGARDNKAATTIGSSATVGCIICGTVISAICFIAVNPLMIFMGADVDTLPYAAAYAKVILIGVPISCCNAVVTCCMRGEGSAKISTIATAAGCIINLGLDPLFIFTFNMGTYGAALATVLSQFISCVVLLYVNFSGRNVIRLSFKSVSKDPKLYRQIISVGFPTFCRQGMGFVATTFLNRAARPYGVLAVAAISYANKIYMMLRQVVIGIGQAYQPVAGYNYGFNLHDRTKKAFWTAVVYGVSVMTFAAILIMIFKENVIAFFNPDPEIIEIGSEMLKYMCFALPCLGYATFVNQLYQCLGFKIPASLLAMCRQGFFFVPLILILPRLLGVTGIVMTQASADILTCIISVPFNIYFFKKHLS